MCLSCANLGGKLDVAVQGKEDLREALNFNPQKTYLHTYDNQLIQLSAGQRNEIIEHAILIIVTGVDLSLDIWAIQWPRDYKTQTF